MIAPEFSRLERVDQIGAVARTVEITAEPAERAALAARFGLVAVDRLDASFAIRREVDGIRAEGRVTAEVVQACGITNVPLPARVDEPVSLRFVADDAIGEEVELDGDQLDTIAYDGPAVDLGEAAAETMALALDPFPRAPGAAEVLRTAGVLDEAETGPFGALVALKQRLAGGQPS